MAFCQISQITHGGICRRRGIRRKRPHHQGPVVDNTNASLLVDIDFVRLT